MSTYTPSFTDLFNAGQARVQQASLSAANPITDFADGSASDLLIGAAAAMGELVIHKLVEDHRRLFFDTAAAIPDGADLDKLAYDRLRISRDPATSASATITLTRPNTSAGSGVVPSGTSFTSVKDPTTGISVTFSLQADVGFSGTDLTKTGLVVATSSGVSGNVGAGKITQIQGSLFDSSLTVSNAQAAAGGNDKETNDQLLARCHSWGAAQRRGTLTAIEYGALTIPAVRRATAVEQGRQVMLYVGDDQGNSNTAMTDSVKAIIDQWRAGGVAVIVAGTVIDDIAVTLQCVWQAGTSTAAARSAIAAAIAAEASSKRYGAGDVIYRSVIAQIALDLGRSLGLLDVQVLLGVSPAAPSAQDLQLGLAHVPRSDVTLINFA
jgi:uncharacterized phage protein gp47/JayE